MRLVSLGGCEGRGLCVVHSCRSPGKILVDELIDEKFKALLNG